ncbi:MAG: enoyl-[acyl-carrier-protein] reductase FabK [Clostridiales bacterium]|nr:enoyl-[acyl-carrier-protein] reductase FabK [Clostridiales bacterium]
MGNLFCESLKIKYPILQGGMAWVSEANLAASVSNAGGFGTIAAANAPATWLEEQINKTKKLTSKPFGVNVMMMSPYTEEIFDLLVKNSVDVVTTGAGNPAKYIQRLKEVGTKVIPVISSVALAKRMEKNGAFAVVAEGCESGGHIGELTTMVLVPQVVDSVQIPVIAAGGIGDRRGVRAAFELGASGVQVGTRFVCSTECIVHQKYKEMIISAKDRDAVVTGRFTGVPVRAIKNKLSIRLEKMEKEKVSLEEFEKFTVGSLRLAVQNGDVENGAFMAGQIAGLIKEIKTCDEIIKELFE